MTEAEYDEIVAPMLLEAAKKVDELGGSLIARVEWEPGESGITQIGISDASGVTQRLTQLAAHCRGNIDALLLGAIKRFDCSQSMFLHSYSRVNETQRP